MGRAMAMLMFGVVAAVATVWALLAGRPASTWLPPLGAAIVMLVLGRAELTAHRSDARRAEGEAKEEEE